jgi:hypothetical protein
MHRLTSVCKTCIKGTIRLRAALQSPFGSHYCLFFPIFTMRISTVVLVSIFMMLDIIGADARPASEQNCGLPPSLA